VSAAERDNRCNESIHELFERQFGLITATQAASYGLSKQSVARRVHSGEWQRVHPGVLRATAAPVSLRQTALAAALWAGDGALVSHGTAAVLHGFESVRALKTELWVPTGTGVRSSRVVVHRGTRLDRADRSTLDGIPITTATRTLIDVSGRLEDPRLLAVMQDLIRRSVVTPERLRARLRALRTSGRPGAGRLEDLLDSVGDGPPLESALETLVWPLIVQSGVPLPVRQHWVTVSSGRYRLDFAWPALKVGIEAQGFRFHGSNSHNWGKSQDRFAELAAAWWRVLPVTWAACTREPRRVIEWIRRAHARAA
jgi:hypothetical protein